MALNPGVAPAGGGGTPAGPLAGVRVVELAGLGPAPLAAMMLAGLGATVIRVDRADAAGTPLAAGYDLVNRGRGGVALDLKHPDGVRALRRLAETADVFLEGFRPGVTERLGIGPDVLLADNPRLVYARMTGWGQEGPLASAVGHDINYIALTGALHATGGAAGPVPPLNLVGDFGGGTMLVLTGILAALHERSTSGAGQVVDAAMVDGVTMLMTMIYDMRNAGEWTDGRCENLLDGGAPFYGTYECSDAGWVAVGAIEPQFFADFERLLAAGALGPQWERDLWPAQREVIAGHFKSATREEWCRVFDGSNACVSPVLAMHEVPENPHVAARGSVTRRPDKTLETRVAPRFSRTPTRPLSSSTPPGASSEAALAAWGFSAGEIDALERSGAIA